MDRPPRLVQLLRGIRAHRGFDVQPARQVAEDDRGAAVAANPSLRSTTPAGARTRVAAGPQRLHPLWDPGFIDHVVNKKAEIVRVYLPPDANCLLSVMDHCLRSRHYVNVVVAGKHPAPQWLDIDAAAAHCACGHRGLAVGRRRPERRTGCGHGLRGRRADAGNAGRRFDPSPLPAGPEGARGQRGGP